MNDASGSAISLYSRVFYYDYMPTETDPAGIQPQVILAAADLSNRRVLEVGAADGRLTFRYAQAPKYVVGLDLKEAEIRSAARNFPPGLLGRVRFLCASAIALPFSAEQFDVVLLASSL